MTDLVLHYGALLCWGIALAGAARCAARLWREEPDRPALLLALAAAALPAGLLPFLLPPRGGYDNEHELECLGVVFFALKPKVSLLFKEYTPLFTDGVVDLLGGRSLQALLWKNRLLPALSACAYFGALRRLGAGLPAAAAGTALLFLNFLSLLGASSFSTASAVMFIGSLSLLALADAHASRETGPGRLAWLLACMVLTAGARFEFLPGYLLLLACVLAAKPAAARRQLLRPAALLVLLAGAALLAPWLARAAALRPAGQLAGAAGPAWNFASQLGSRNLAALAGRRPEYPEPGRIAAGPPQAADHALAWLFLLAALAGAAADPAARRRNLALAAPLLAWGLYYSFIYGPPDFYPLHFMRHQLFFFVPFALLAALGLNGLKGALPPAAAGRPFALALAALTAAYAAVNLRAAKSYDGELRTNDRELAFLAGAQRSWPAGCAAFYPRYGRESRRYPVLAKYFPALPPGPRPEGACVLKYASPEPFIFTEDAPPPLALPALGPGPAPAWRETSFAHSFYTVFRSGVGAPPRVETTAPVPLRIGFYPPSAPRDRAYLLAADGLRAFAACDRGKAGRLLREAAAAEPGNPHSGYLLALAEAWQGRRRAAGARLAGLAKRSPGGLAPEHLSLADALLAGDRGAALAAVSGIEARNPGFFLGADVRAGLRCGARPEGAFGMMEP